MTRICEAALDPDAGGGAALAPLPAAIEARCHCVQPEKVVKPVLLRANERSHIDRLLRSLINAVEVVPIEADTVHDCRELPSAWLRNLILTAIDSERSWRCFMDSGLRVWLFIAALSVPLSRQLGVPVLQVDFYRESGLQETAHWSIDRDSRWHRCAVGPQPKRDDDWDSDEPALTSIDFYRPGAARG